VHVLEAKLLNPDGEVKQCRLPFVVASQLWSEISGYQAPRHI
jgi:hypothetical protein